MAEYDGSIRIVTKITTRDAEESLSSLEWTIKNSAKEIDRLRKKMYDLKGVEVPTKEYEKLEKDLIEAVAAADKLVEKQNEYKNLGMEAPEGLVSELDKASLKVGELEEKILKLKEGGKAFTLGEDTAQYKAWEQQIKYEEEAIIKAGDHYQKLLEGKSVVERTSEAWKNLQETLEQVKSTHAGTVPLIEAIKAHLTYVVDLTKEMKEKLLGLASSIKNGLTHPLQSSKKIASGVFSVLKKGFSSIGELGKSAFSGIVRAAKKGFSAITGGAKKSGGMLSTFSSRLKGLALSLLIFNWISKGFNAMISGMKTGFSNFAGYSDSYAQNVQNMKNAMSTLGNQFAAAFAPIAQVVIPWLTSLVNAISTAMTYVAQFIAALGGKNTFTKAKKVQDDYNKSLGGTAKAADKARGALAKFDDLDVLEKKQEDTGGGGGGIDNAGADMFEEAPVESEWENLANNVKYILSQIFEPFKQAWESQGKFVMDSWKYAFEEIGLLAKSVGSDFLEVWNQPETVSILENMLIIVGDIGLSAGNLARNFKLAWDENDTGKQILETIRNIILDISNHVKNMAGSFSKFTSELNFSPLLNSVLKLMKSLEPLADNVGAGLEWFWTNVLLPMAGWTIKEAVPAFLNALSGAIDLLNAVIETLKPFGEWLWENFLKPLGEWTGGVIVSVMESIADILSKIGDWISEHSEAIQTFITIVAPIAGTILLIANAGSILSAAMTALGIAFSLLTSPVTLAIAAIAALAAGFIYLYENSEGFREFIDGIIETAGEIIPGIMEGIKAGWDAFINWIKGLWQSIIDWFKEIFGIHSPSTVMAELGTFLMEGLLNGIQSLVDAVTAIWEFMKNIAIGVWESVKSLISGIINAIKTIILTVMNVISTIWNAVWGTIKAVASSVWGGIKSTISTIINGIKTTISTVLSAIKYIWDTVWTGLKTTVTNIFNGIWNTIKKIINSILGGIEGMANGVIRGINSIINALNGLSFTIPATPFSDEMTIGLNLPTIQEVSIPRLATGAVIRGGNPFMAILGDQPAGQTNIEAPLDTIRQAVREELSGMNFGNAGAAQAKIVLNINGVDVGEAMLDDLFSVMARRGYDVSVLGVT